MATAYRALPLMYANVLPRLLGILMMAVTVGFHLCPEQIASVYALD